MTNIERVPVIGGFAKIIEAPFKLLGDTGMAVGSLFTGDTEGFKNGLGGMVNDVIDVPSGVLDVGEGILTVPKAAMGGQTSSNSSSVQKITMGTGNAMDIPIGVVQLGNDALDAIRPSRKGYAEIYGNVPERTTKEVTTVTTQKEKVEDTKNNKKSDVIVIELPKDNKSEKTEDKSQTTVDEAQQADKNLRTTITEAQQTDNNLKDTIDEAQQADKNLKDTIGEAQQADNNLRATIDEANKTNDEIKNNIQILLDNKQDDKPPVAEAPKKDKKFNWKLWGTVAGVAAAVGLAFLFRGKIKNLFKNRKLAKTLKNQPDVASKVLGVKPTPVATGQVIEGTPSVISTEQILPNSILKKAAKQPQYTLAAENFTGSLSVKADNKVGDVLRVADQKFDAGKNITIKAQNLQANAANPAQKLIGAGDDTIDLVKVGGQYVPQDKVQTIANGPRHAQGAANAAGTTASAAGSAPKQGLAPGATNDPLDYMKDWYTPEISAADAKKLSNVKNSNIASQPSAIQMMEQEKAEVARAQKLNRLATEAETTKGQKASNDIKNRLLGEAQQAKVQAQKAEAQRVADAQKKLAEIEAKEKEALIAKTKAKQARKQEKLQQQLANKEARKAENAKKVAAKEAADKEYSASYQRNKALTQAPDKENKKTFDALKEDIIARSNNATQPKYPSLSESGRNLFPAWNDKQMALLDEAGEAIRAKEAADAAKAAEVATAAKDATGVVSNKTVLATATSGRKINLEQLPNYAGQKVRIRLNPNGVPKKELTNLKSSFRSLMGGKANALPKNGAIVEVEVTPSTFGQIKKLYRHLEIMAA